MIIMVCFSATTFEIKTIFFKRIVIGWVFDFYVCKQT